MTVVPPSRQTLANLIPMIEQANLSPIQKRDQISAVWTVARLLGAAADEIDVDPVRLRRRLESIAPEAFGLSRGRTRTSTLLSWQQPLFQAEMSLFDTKSFC